MCFGCGRELIENLSTKRAKYFSHRVVDKCNPESYLHNFSKHMFFTMYSLCLENRRSLFLKQKVPGECSHYQELLGRPCKVKQFRQHDLTRYFTKVDLEAHAEGVIPDVPLTSEDGQNRLFAEIAVTH
jgi:hypothetical protein